MPVRGGASDKAGNRYERLWTVLALLDVLAGEADSIRIEVPGEAGRGAEFVLMRDAILEWHQAKRQRTAGPWTIASLDRAGVLEPWWPKLQSGDRCVFVSGTSAQQLNDLAERAARAESWAEFDEEFLGARDHRDNFARLSRAWRTARGEPVFLALRQVSVHVIDEKQLSRRVADRAAYLVDADPAAAVRCLAEIADDSTHRRLSRPELLRLIAETGLAPVRAGAGHVRERHAASVQQVLRDSAGANVHISGEANTVSVHIAGRTTAERPTRLLACLAIVLASIAGAAYLVFRDPGVPQYFQTGPDAGITVPPSSLHCQDVTPDVLISPADNVLTNVSEAHALSLDGRSAFLMQGTFNGTIYHWMTSVPNGRFGGMRLHWQVKGGKDHFCTVSLSNASPSASARQVASMAVPAVVNGRPVSFTACVWYTVRKGDIPRHCWP